MSNYEHKNGKGSQRSRNDDLIADYLSELLPVEELKNDVLHQKIASDNSPEIKNADAAKHSTGSTKEANHAVADHALIFERREERTSAVQSDKRYSLKRADEVIAARSERPFKEEVTQKSALISGLMPKLKPARVSEEETARSESQPVQEEIADVEPEVLAPVPTIEPATTIEEVSIEPVDEADDEVGIASSDHGSGGEPPNKAAPSGFRELSSFEALLFDVRGLQLAVPLVTLGSIHRLEGEFTPIVGRANWFLGMYRVNDRNLQVVDTARWVMPGRPTSASDEEYEFVIRLGDSNWALACSAVHQSMRIEQDEIKWRTKDSRRPWLAGTVISKMCALLDVENMSELLDQDKLQD